MAADTAIEQATEDTAESSPDQIPEKKKLQPNRLDYDGQNGQLFRIWLVNLFMKIITLGIYSFWGKTRLRKYVYGSFSLGGDRFEYTGTGGELFKGFLKVMPILVVILGPIAIFGETHPAVLLLYIPFFYLFGVAIYGAMRYRFSRTRWRGIRGRLGGSAFKYGNITALRFLLNIITLGFAKPYSDIAKHRYMMNNAYFGNVQAEFKGDAKRIYGAYLIFLISTAVLLTGPIIILFFGMAGTFSAMGQSGIERGMPALFVIIFSFFILFAIILPLLKTIYTAALQREQMRGLVVGDLRFKSTVTAWKLFKHQLGNLLWIICTLGLATAHVINRRAAFMANNTIIGGDLDTSEIMQGKDEGITSGEGLEDALDIDMGFI